MKNIKDKEELATLNDNEILKELAETNKEIFRLEEDGSKDSDIEDLRKYKAILTRIVKDRDLKIPEKEEIDKMKIVDESSRTRLDNGLDLLIADGVYKFLDGPNVIAGGELEKTETGKYIVESLNTDEYEIKPLTKEQLMDTVSEMVQFVTEACGNKTDEITEEEFHPGNMLPQTPAKGTLKKVTDLPKENERKVILSEKAIEFIRSDELDFTVLEESSKDSVLNQELPVNISRKLRLTILNIAILNAKLSIMTKKKVDAVKINEIKQEIIKNEKIARDLSSGFNTEEKAAVKKLETLAKKEAIKDLEADNFLAKLEEDVTHQDHAKEDKVNKELPKYKGKRSTFTKESVMMQTYQNKIDENNERLAVLEESASLHQNEIAAIKTANYGYQVRLNMLREEDDEKYFKEYMDDVIEQNLSGEAKDKVTSLFTEAMTILNDKLQKRNDSYAKSYRSTLSENDLNQLMIESERYNLDYQEYREEIKKYFTEACESIHDVPEGTLDEASFLNFVIEAATIEPEIRDIISELNRKGYKTKYSSPGHRHLRKKEDAEPDGVYYGKLYSDARVMFDGKFNFPAAPKYWFWRDVEGNSYLDIRPVIYNEKDGTPDEAFAKWKTDYMNSLRNWVAKLKPASSGGGLKGEEKKEDSPEDEKTEDKETKESLESFNDYMNHKFNLYKESVLED